jgi:hypothetical protein
MLFWKLFSHLATGALTTTAILMQVYHTDKRTRRYRYTKNAFIGLSIIAFLVQGIVLWVDHNDNQTQITESNKQLGRISVANDSLIKEFRVVNGALDTVKAYAVKHDTLLTPFVAFSMRYFKEQDTVRALTKLNREIPRRFNIQMNNIETPNNKGIVTQNQSGGTNMINNINPITTLPQARVRKIEVVVSNKEITSIEGISFFVDNKLVGKKKVQLPSEELPYAKLYLNTILLDYYSIVQRQQFIMVLEEDGCVGVHAMAKKGSTGMFVSRIAKTAAGRLGAGMQAPPNGEYIVDYYTIHPVTDILKKLRGAE